MAAYEISTLTDGETQYYDQRVRLGGVDWVFEFLYSDRRGVWTFSVANLDGEYVLTGQTVTCGVSLLARAVGGPVGTLLAIPASADNLSPPGLTELGDRVRLVWFDATKTPLVPATRTV